MVASVIDIDGDLRILHPWDETPFVLDGRLCHSVALAWAYFKYADEQYRSEIDECVDVGDVVRVMHKWQDAALTTGWEDPTRRYNLLYSIYRIKTKQHTEMVELLVDQPIGTKFVMHGEDDGIDDLLYFDQHSFNTRGNLGGSIIKYLGEWYKFLLKVVPPEHWSNS